MLQASKSFFKRKFRKRKRQMESIGARAEHVSERYFFGRFDRLPAIRRFVIGWLLLLVLVCGTLVGQIRALDGYFQQLQPVAGGIYTEGILGDFTNANPLYASSPVDESVSRLLFASLFKYDDNNRLVGDLATNYEVDATERIYTVHLKPNLVWHDGQPLTADDVAFTYGMIQNPDALSIHNQSWQGIKIAVIDKQTITFTLPNVLASFPYNMTNGIIPEHILRNVEPGEMRSASFNTMQPVGAGPFAWNTIEVTGESPETRQSQIALRPFQQYQGGVPKLAGYVVHSYHNADQLAASFRSQELTAASFTDAPKDILAENGVVANDFMFSAADMVFFKRSNPVLADVVVRKALVTAVNVPAIIESLGYTTRPVREPFLLGQIGYDRSLEQSAFDPAGAARSLDAAGWLVGDDGIRTKNGTPLRFSLYGQNKAETRQVTNELVAAWRSVGAEAVVKLQDSDDLQRSLGSREYDALLYGISIGVDPDTFVYWHSSQTDIRSSSLNFSEFKSKTADTALEAGRTRIDPELRAVKYKPFLQAWQQDTPALGLYQPRYLYLTHGTVYGLKQHVINSETDRYANVQNWQIRQTEVTRSR